MPRITSKKKMRYGSVSIVLTVAVLAVAILSNAIVTALAMRYGWFCNMNPDRLYPVTDTCYAYLDEYVFSKSDADIEFIFCSEKEEVLEDGTQAMVHATAAELAESYPDRVSISYLNVWEHPKKARSYGVTASTDVVVRSGDNHRVCTLKDFFTFSAADTTLPTAYNGEKRFAVAMKAVVSSDTPMAYFTVNHGESFPDYSLLIAATDAGYTVSYLDALSFDIPEDCDLLVTYNPAQDFTAIDGVSGFSEIDKLEAYLEKGGNYMVFVSADTFSAGGFANLEGFLEKRGVTFDHRTGEENVEECYAIRDLDHALSTDGYTLFGKVPEGGKAAEIMEGVGSSLRLSNATSISPAKDFTSDGKDSYTKGDYRMTTLLTSHPGAEAWAGGRATERTTDGFPMITLTENKAQNSHVMVCSSTEFATETTLQSASYDNAAFLLTAMGAMGKTDIPVQMKSQPFDDTTIDTLTTRQARNITVVLTAVPTTLVLAAGLIILIRRKFA